MREDIEGGDFDRSRRHRALPPPAPHLPTQPRRRKNDPNVEMSQGAVKMMLMSGETLKLFIDSTCLSLGWGLGWVGLGLPHSCQS